MTSQNQFLIVGITWAVLFVLYSIERFLLRDKLSNHISKGRLVNVPGRAAKPPGTLLSKVGVLFVFVVNIVSIMLLLIAALTSSPGQSLALVKVNLPLWVNAVGGMLFVADTIWGFFAMVFNPNYTPLYSAPPQQFVLATRGPYGITRHPRYTSEAFLNIALFLLTGIWLPLLGLIGWIAIYRQACAEENYLMMLAGKEYGEYRKKTGMFFPKLGGKRLIE